MKIGYLPEGGYEVNPPFVEKIMQDASNLM